MTAVKTPVRWSNWWLRCGEAAADNVPVHFVQHRYDARPFGRIHEEDHGSAAAGAGHFAAERASLDNSLVDLVDLLVGDLGCGGLLCIPAAAINLGKFPQFAAQKRRLQLQRFALELVHCFDRLLVFVPHAGRLLIDNLRRFSGSAGVKQHRRTLSSCKTAGRNDRGFTITRSFAANSMKFTPPNVAAY